MGWLRAVRIVTGRCEDRGCVGARDEDNARRWFTCPPPKRSPHCARRWPTPLQRRQAARRSELGGELRVVRTERDLLKEQLNRFKRQLFEAKSEVQRRAPEGLVLQRGRGRRCIRPSLRPPRPRKSKIDVPAHQRAKRGRKPLDPALPREVRRHELPEDERVCPHDGAALERDRRGGQRAAGHRAAAGARDPPRAREVRVPVLRRRPAPGGASRRR